MWKNWNLYILRMVVKNSATNLENCLAIAIEAKYSSTLWPRNFTARYTPTRKEFICSPKGIYNSVHRALINNIPKLETTKMFINRRMGNKLWYIYTKEYSTIKRTSYWYHKSMDEDPRQYVEQNKWALKNTYCMFPFIVVPPYPWFGFLRFRSQWSTSVQK